jgi:hypothetical protein
LAFAVDSFVGRAMRVDTSDRPGHWQFNLSGFYLPLCSNIKVYSQALMKGAGAADTCHFDYSLNDTTWFRYNSFPLTLGQWKEDTASVPVSGVSKLYLRVTYSGGTGIGDKSFLMDNFQVNAQMNFDSCSYDADPSITGWPTNVMDNCDKHPVVFYVDTIQEGPTCSSETLIFRSWTVIDDCENMDTATQIITILDTLKPIITCPIDVTVNCEQSTDPDSTGYATAFEFCYDTMVLVTHLDSILPGTCPGDYTILREWTAMDSCGNTSVCTQVITVIPIEGPELTCPNDTTLIACQTQGAVNAAFDAWLETVQVSGGCYTELNDDNTGPPDACGGSKTVTFTATSDCEDDQVCMATFTVTAAPVVVLTCPVNATEAACQTQAAIDTKFTTWLGTAMFTGGCNGVLTNNNTGAPMACGGSKTVTFTVTSTCEPNKICTATFTVTAAPAVVLTCPVNATEAACQTQTEIDNKFTTWLGTAMFTGGCNSVLTNDNTGAPMACGGTKTVIFTVNSDCEGPKTCTATFTVTAAPPVMLTCPTNATEAACQTQAEIDTKFTTWLGTAMFTGGCNGMLSNDNSGAPMACGGTKTVVFTVTSSCESNNTCSATFTVDPAPPVMLTCPTNQTEAACQTQTEINTKFNTWLGTVSYSGGCNAMLSNDNSGAPDKCGGVATVTFTVSSSCESNNTCTATFTVTPAPAVVLNCPANQTEASCQSQTDINNKFTTWLGTANFSGGCNATLSNDNSGAPDKCGGVATVTFTVTSTCEPNNTCTATFTVTPAPAVVLTCPVNATEAECQTQSAIDTKFTTWLGTAMFTGGCNGVLTNDNTGAPMACGGSKTVTFTVTSDCEGPKTCMATFTVTAAPAVVLTCPTNATEAECQTQSAIDTKFNTWLGTAMFTGGCNGVLTNDNTGAPMACGGSKTVTFTVTSDCEGPKTCMATFTVTAAPAVVLTCPTNATEAECQTQSAIDAKFTTWLGTAMFTGGCNGVLTNDNTGAPMACGGSKTVIFTVNSDCEGPKTCTATFTVTAAPIVVLTCPTNQTEAACQTQAAIDAKFTTWLGTAMFTGGCNGVMTNDNTGAPMACGGVKMVTFTVTSDCEPNKTCTATFTVTDAPVVVLNCPTNQTEAACQTQAAIDAKFTTWLGTANFSGGCNAMMSNNSTTAPDHCGGVASVIFTVTSDCEPNKTCTATFTVDPAPVVNLTCPVNATEAACQTQAQIDTKFNTWLGTAMFTGGCNGMLSNNSTTAPNACGGSASVTFTVTSDCEPNVTCTATFTVDPAPPVMLTCPANVTEAACQTQAAIDAKFNTWLGTAMFTGGCNGMLSNNNSGPAPDHCGGSKSVTYTVTSDCEPNVTCTATFTVDPAPPVMLTCPANVTEAACQTQAAIDAKFNTWLGTAMFTGGCNGMLSNNNSGPAPDHCGGSKSVTYTVTSDCEPNVTCTATFTVDPAPAVVLTCPTNATEAACQSQSAIDAKFNTWLGTAMFTGGCNGMMSNNSTTSPNACGGSASITFTVTSDCEPNQTCTATFTVDPAPPVNLTCPASVTEAACQSQSAIDAKFNTWLGTAMFTGGCNGMLSNNSGTPPNACGGSASVTFTVTSDCEPNVTCTATFTVTPAPPVMLTCPANVTEAACQTQAQIDTKFNTWLGTAMFTGGCNGMMSNNSTTAPDHCGGVATVTYTVTSDCEPNVTCTATFTVDPAPPVMLTCPANVTEAACQTQAQIDTKFNTWLGTAMFTGGCNGMLSNNSTTAPDHCGGVATVTYTVTSDCEPNVTCTATFTVDQAPPVMLTCPANVTEAACQTQAQIDTKFNTWLGTAMFTGGCNGMLSNNNSGPAPDHCGGSKSVTYTVTSDCEPNVTCTATFTVDPAPPVMLTCPANVTEAACQTQAQIDTKFNTWLGTAMFTGGCNGMLSNNNSGPAPDHCGGSKSVTYTVTSDCEPNVTCTATFTVDPAPVVNLTCPVNATEAACQTQAAIDAKFNTWLGTAMFTGGCNGMLSNNNSGPAPDHCGGSKSVTFTVTSDCEPNQTCTATFTVDPAPAVVLTCPTNATEAACQSQSAIDAKFNTWLGTAMFTGGCNGMMSNNSTTAPNACGGSASITFTVTSDCEPNQTCTATFTVDPAPPVNLTCPASVTEAACQTQSAIDAKFNTWLGTAMFTGGCNGMLSNNSTTPPNACGGSASVTFTVTSDCEPNVTCTATFTITPAPPVMLTCPANVTEAACQTQAQIDTKFNTWLGTAMFTGGCNGMMSNNSTTAPDHCGGVATVTYTVTSDCEPNVTCTATFTVDPAPPVMLTCPANVTEAACQTQAQIDTKFNTWLGTAMFTGGCNGMLSNNSTTAPDHCGGVATVTYTVTSDCEPNVTCTATFTVDPAPAVMLTCPANVTEAACQTQAQIDTKFNTWLGTAMFTGGCNGMLSNNNSGPAPDHCGGSKSVTYTVTSDCEPNVTCTATFTVDPAPPVMLTCPANVTEAACQTQAAIDAKFNTWLGTAMFTGGCNGMLSNNNSGPAPDHCGGSKSVTYTVTSDCEPNVTCTATFTVDPAPVVNLTCPVNATEAACQTQAAIDAKFNTWLGTAMFTGGCNGMLSNNNSGPAPDHCGGSKSVTFTVTSDCEPNQTCTATFTVDPAPAVVLTCPTNATEAACQSQSAIDAKFNTWLGTAMFTGGCNGMMSNNSTTAPNACGGSASITFTVTSDCEPNQTCTATFTVDPAPPVNLTCPASVTEAACQSQSAIDAKFNTWLGTAMFTGGCNGMMSNNSTTAPNACGGSASITFTVTSDCEPNVTCTATFTVTPAPAVMLTCPANVTEAACQTQAQIDTKFNTWLGTANFSGGCNAMMSNNSTTAPDHCGGVATVTYTVTSDCEPNVTCMATFTVDPAPPVMLTCPANVTEAACQTQSAIDTKFNTWLGTAMFTGGCNAMLSNNSTTAPDHCGGVATVTYTVTSDCEPNVTCTATFTVDPAPAVMLTCPANVTEAACQTQAQIDTKFNAWLGTATFSGGCNAMLSNNNSGPAPDHCGGSKSVTYTVTSDCEPNVTCTATFTVTPAPAVMLTCPANVTEAACQTQAQIDAKFNTWLGTGMFTGGCNGILSNDNSGPIPDHCGGSKSVTYTVTSDCEPNVTCTATFTVTPAPAVVLTCPVNATEVACQTQAAIDAKFNTWLGTAMFTGGCNGMLSNNNSGPAPDHCGGSKSVTFTVTSDCEPAQTCTATFTVDPAPAVVLTCPINVTEVACQTQAAIDAKFNTWLGTAMFTGGCNGVLTNDNSGPAPDHCGGSKTVTFTVNSDCEDPMMCTATFTVDPAPAVVLTCPVNTTEAACQSQSAIDAKFNTWLGTAMFTGGCNGMLSNNSTTPPNACGGSASITFTVTSDCETPKTCTATFTVTPAPIVVLNCPVNQTEAACQSQTDINNKFNTWLGTASFSGGCNAMLSNNSTTAPDHCGGVASVTFTVTSDCEPNKTCTATFTVTPAPVVVLNCPVNQTEAACQSQTDINNKFNTWLGTASFSGGCNAMMSNNSTTASDHCGGVASVTFTVTSDCEPNKVCTATFTVTPAPVVVLNCPVNQTEVACQTQSAIDAKFNTWLGTASFSGGCNGMLSNDNTGPNPDHCGGSKSVTFTVTSDCEPVKTCTASFTVLSSPVTLNCPINQTEAACQTQAQIDTKFNAWLGTANFTGGCNATLSNDNSGPNPSFCGGSKSITFTVTSDCEAPKTCLATFTVSPAPAVVINCPVNQNEVACQTQAQIDAKFNIWLGTASFSGGCNGMLSNDNSGPNPSPCGGSKTVTFTVTSSCEGPKTCSATFTVNPAPPVVLTCPVNQTEVACQTQAAINAKFTTWLATVSATGGCNPVFTNNNTGAPLACGGTTTVTFTVTSDCESPKTCSATFTVSPAPAVSVTCPVSQTEGPCQTQAIINSKFSMWLNSISVSGGCNTQVSNNNTGAPSFCGGTTTVIFTVTSDCEPNVTCTATFTVSPATPVNLTCPVNQTEAACQNQAAIDTKFNTWLGTVSFSGGCNSSLSNNNTGAPSFCGGSKTVTFTVTSDCESPKTCMATFTVNPTALIVLNCPVNQTEVACQTQASIDTKFNTWLGTVSFSGGCNPTLSNNNTGAPSFCGGSKTVTFTVTSDCEVPKTCTATFTVDPAPVVVLTCPVNQTEAACQTQAVINTKFTAWLNTVVFSGGCNATISNNNTGAPNACGGTTTVTFTATSDCESPKTCSATFTVSGSPTTLTCPMNQTEVACQTQAQIDTKFATWLASVSATGGCNTMFSNNNTGAPNACGGTTTVTFTLTSDCDAPKTCSATFTVLSSPVNLTCPTNQTEAACQTQAQIDTKFATWLSTVNFSGGCNATISNDNNGAPNFCGGSKTVSFTVTSSCEVPRTCSATFTVNTAPPVSVTCPFTQTEAACQTQAQIDTKFATWLTTINVSGGCNTMVTNNNTGAPNFCGGTSAVIFTVTSSCEPSSTCTASFIVNPAPGVVLTCPLNQTEAACQTQADIDSKFATWLSTVNVTGGCNPVVTNNNSGAPNFCGGTTTVVFTVTSSCASSSTCSAVFTVNNAPNLTLTCPANVSEAACQTQAQINTKFAAWLSSVSTTGGCNPVVTNNNSGAPNFCGGTTTVIFTVTSSCASSSTCSATFTVLSSPITITCPNNVMEVSCQTQNEINTKFNNWLNGVLITGGCNPVVSNNNNGAPNECGGSKTVTFTVTSDCDIPKSCTATFTVETIPDPQIVCPPDVTIDCDESTLPSNTGVPAAVDGCNGTPNVSYDDQITYGDCPGDYVITRTWLAVDKCNKTDECMQIITVVNTVVPTFTLPPDITIFKSTSASATAKTIVNYDFNKGISYRSLSPYLYPGITSVVDTSSNMYMSTIGVTTGVQAFTVNSVAGKGLKVTNSQQNGHWQFNLAGRSLPSCTNFEVYVQAQRKSNGSATTLLMDYSTNGTTWSNFSSTPLTIGNWVECVAAIPGVANPNNLYIRVRYSGGSNNETKELFIDNFQVRISKQYEACAFDDGPDRTGYPSNINHPCDADPSFTYKDSLDAGDCVSKVFRTWIVTDNCGNSSSGTGKQVITVKDSTGPVITCPSSNVQVRKADTTKCYYTVVNTEFDATAFDLCQDSSVTITNDLNNSHTLNGYRMKVGRDTIKWTATDACGNTSVCFVKVDIYEIEPPEARCKENTIILDSTGRKTITVDTLDNNSTDNCGIQTRFLNRYTYTCDDIPFRIVTLTVIDSSGLIDTCTAKLYIIDNVKPKIVCKNLSFALPQSKTKTITALDVLLSNTDNCGILTRVVVPNTFNCDSPKNTTVTVTVTDVNGNSSTCTSIVTITNDSDNDGIYDPCDNCINNPNPNQMDSDCDKVGDVCDVCPNGDDSVDNNGDGLPDCKYPPTFANILSSWKCGNIPQRVYVASIGTNGQCTRRCVLYTTYLRDKGPNLHLGPCKSCGEGFTDNGGGEEVIEYIYEEQDGSQVSVSKPKGEYDFILVPNPNEGEFEIQFDQPVEQGTVKVINMLGQEVWNFEIKELTHLIKVSEQSFKFHTSGMYRVMLLSNNGKKIHNLMIISK